MSAAAPGVYDPFSPEVIRDPFPWYERLRAGPRAFHVPGTDIFAVSRYDDVLSVVKNPAVFSSTGGVGPEWKAHPMMSMYDPPEHTRLRRIVAAAFTPKTVEAMAAAIRADVDRRLEELATCARVCLVEDFAEPLIAGIIADLIGIPEEMKSSFRRWSVMITSSLARNVGPEIAEEAERSRRELVGALRALAGPSAPSPAGLIGVLRSASSQEKLTDPELIAFCVLLLVAGFETTVNGLANGLHAILTRPEAARAFELGPASTPALVEELLRFDPPVHAFFRNTLTEASFADGSTIPARSKVMVLFASANHDSEVFPEPSRLRLDRTAAHVSFGAGPHHCIGAPLARTLYTITYDAWRRLRVRACLEGEAVRTENTLLRGFRSMRVALSSE